MNFKSINLSEIKLLFILSFKIFLTNKVEIDVSLIKKFTKIIKIDLYYKNNVIL